MHMLTVKPLSVLTLYGLGDMLDIPQQNALKYGFSGIERYFSYIVYIDHHIVLLLTYIM